MKKYLEKLKKCPIFFGIEDNVMEKMLVCLGAKVKNYEKKESIVYEGSEARFVGIILSGRAKVMQVDWMGNRSIVSELRECESFGESFAYAVTEGIPVNIVADERCEVMFIESLRMIQPCCNACDFHKQLILNLMRSLANQNVMFHKRMEITSKRSTRDKLLTYLSLVAREKHSLSFDIPYDRQELADFLEVERSGLSAEISKLRREGILLSERNHFELTEAVI